MDEYEKEGIHNLKVPFTDNQICLDMIERKPSGIIPLLDDESKFPKATDLGFVEKITVKHERNPRFIKLRKKSVMTEFAINHFAGEVIYDAAGFIEKNKDQLNLDILSLMST